MYNHRIKLVIALHKKYKVPSDEMYLPLHVGSEINKVELGYQKDNEGENISKKNPNFCELTALYWAWKNLDFDYIGLVHYRRYFSLSKTKSILDVLSYNQIKDFVPKIRIFVPKKRRYYIETVYSQYSHSFHQEHLELSREVIKQKFPEYLESFDYVMKQRSAYMFNMMIMEKQLLDKYCTWLYSVLSDLESMIDVSKYDAFHARCFGRISERLFNVWLTYMISKGEVSKDEIKELPYVYMGKINWPSKIFHFLLAKIFGLKYKKSF